MKKQYFVSFNEGRASFHRLCKLLEPIGCRDGLPADASDILAGAFSSTFGADDPRLEELRALLRREGIKWSEREEHVYSDSELRSSPLLLLSVDRRPLDHGGPDYGTTYDLSKACPLCGSCAVQTSPLLVAMTELPKRGLLCSTVCCEALVAQPLAVALEQERVTGLELRQVRFYRNEEPLPWWQMLATFEMPKLSPQTRGVVLSEVDHVVGPDLVIRAEPPCSLCQRDGRFMSSAVPAQLAYSRQQVNPSALPDVAKTWEVFGKVRWNRKQFERSWFGNQLILVKPRVFDIFRRLKVKSARFVPVRFVD